ncbi:hypothetical protein JM84_2454 [Dokdonia sp. Hel_I_63]|uniref:hypothetical protein n=1 Tax=unclassified Dokdonia TaxID=2615033 RepID=UPI00020A6DD4|nr:MULTISPECIES: hypothetical protein [unclassified Dokdonia]AEE20226.1 hypothetical protein Krodi_2245 [Dokdonia sp. 4H-3-7-5]TVZ23520.1 hypothetical protein JM84_2454 [Dokdonia sp. Hel_I_63]
MKKINFENLSWNWTRIALLILASLCLSVGFGLLLNYKNGLITSLGFVILIIMLSKRFWYKNHVEYNKLGIVIKLNLITDRTIKFNEIDKININDNKLIVKLNSERKFEFQIKDIDSSDINKLLRILIENSKSIFTDNRTEKLLLPIE